MSYTIVIFGNIEWSDCHFLHKEIEFRCIHLYFPVVLRRKVHFHIYLYKIQNLSKIYKNYINISF